MKKIVRLTEGDLVKIIKRVISEETTEPDKPIPSTTKKFVKGTFNWDNMLKLWRTNNQGYTPGDDFMWFSYHPGVPSFETDVLSLYTFGKNANFSQKYSIRYDITTSGEYWWPEKHDYDNWYQSNTGVLYDLTVGVFSNKFGEAGVPINKELYIQFLSSYITKYPESPTAKAFTQPPIRSAYVDQEKVEQIQNSPIYQKFKKIAPTQG